jgi:hypothetical protein
MTLEFTWAGSTSSNSLPSCQWCGQVHFAGICPKVKSIEYFPNGQVKWVEFWGPMTYNGNNFTPVMELKPTKATCEVCDAPIEFNEQYGIWMHLRSGVNHTASPKEGSVL